MSRKTPDPSSSPDTAKVVSFADAARPHDFARKEKRLEETRQAFENYLEAGEGLSRQQKRKKARDVAKKKGRPNKHP